MTIKLDWFGCNPRPTWESQIHQMVGQLSAVKTISQAQVRVEQLTQKAPPYHLSICLSLPGPDVLASAAGHTFEEALLKLTAIVHKTLRLRAMKARGIDAAPRGVKAAHRG